MPLSRDNLHIVTGMGTVSYGDDELLVSFVCATGATYGAKCAAPDASATGAGLV